MKAFFCIALCFGSLSALDQGELKFSLGNKNYATQHAQGLIQVKGGKARIHIAVKDVNAHFMLVFTADVQPGWEKQILNLNTEDSSLNVAVRTRAGTFAVTPHTQLAKADTQLTYTERADTETEQLEDEPEEKNLGQSVTSRRDHVAKKRRKFKSEYRRVKPKWHNMPKSERIKTGEGVISNNSFRDTYFALRLVPVLSQGKVVSYTGSFSGAGRFSSSVSGADVKTIQNGVFHVRVENAQ